MRRNIIRVTKWQVGMIISSLMRMSHEFLFMRRGTTTWMMGYQSSSPFFMWTLLQQILGI